jgi:hypothetical protein
MKFNFKDNLVNFFNGLVNSRNTTNTNGFANGGRIEYDELRAMYKKGIGSKIVRIKAGYALDDTLKFKSKEDELKYNKLLAKHVKIAAKYMVGFGRGMLVIVEDQTVRNLSLPLSLKNIGDESRIVEMAGDSVEVLCSNTTNILAPRYNKPDMYILNNGAHCHPSRVIDFTYFEPSPIEKRHYRFGGISEFEIAYEQFVADAIVQRATPAMLEKSSTLFYKIEGFREAMQSGQEQDALKYFSTLESARSIYGAGIIDSEDSVETISQNLTNLAESDQISLRRLAMVTGIPLAVLVGEAVRGLNATGDNEMKIFQDMIETLQSEYLLEPIKRLCAMFGIEDVEFAENQGETPLVRAEFDTKVIDNALKLWNMGENYQAYLEDKGVLLAKSGADGDVSDADMSILFPEMSEDKEEDAAPEEDIKPDSE